MTAASLVAVVGLAGGVADAAQITTASGPLTRVAISTDLNCAVSHVADASPEFYGDTACATLVASGGVLYGPVSIPAGGAASPRTGFTPVSQVQGGSGTAADPFFVTTVVAAGASGLQISQTDTYIAGQETYRTDVTVANTTAGALSAVVYKAADCFLQNSDSGYGAFDPSTGAVSCVASLSPGARIEQFFPLSPGSSYVESFYGDVWARVGTQQPFANECAQCTSLVDNGMGLSWTISLAAGATTTLSHLTNFSPLGNVPLVTTKTARDATTPAGGTDAYTITINNPNLTAVTIDSISDELPTGFSYVAGSTTGATTSDASITGSTLRWSGPLTVGANSNLAITFGVNVGSTVGTFYNQAFAIAAGTFTVAPTGATAPIEVVGAPTNNPPMVDAGTDRATAEGSPVALDASVTDPDVGDTVTTTWSASAAGVDAGATCSFADPAAIDTTVTCTDDGTWTLTLAASDGVNSTVTDVITLTVSNAAPVVSIASPADLSVVPVGSIAVSAPFTDAGSNDTHACTIDWGDTTSSAGVVAAGVCTGSHVYATAATYTITVTVTDDDEAAGSAFITLVVTDSETKVSGGGFVLTPSRTSFGFVAKQSATGAVGGQIEVQAPGQHRFHGDTVASLTASGNTATWSGTGRWDGTGGYSFTVTVADNRDGGSRKGTADTITLSIQDAGGAVVHSASGPLQGGNLTVHR